MLAFYAKHFKTVVWAARLRTWRLESAYVYFDSDQAGYAPANARRLREILSDTDG